MTQNDGREARATLLRATLLGVHKFAGQDSFAGEASVGANEQVGVGRGIAELRAGRPVMVRGDGAMLSLPVEFLDDERLAAFRGLGTVAAPRLLLTQRRARALGLDTADLPPGAPVALAIRPDADAAQIIALAAGAASVSEPVRLSAGPLAGPALDLAKLAHVLPALLVADADAAFAASFDPPLVTVKGGAVACVRAEAARTLAVAGEANVPLSAGVVTRFVVFRNTFGDEPVAVVVGTPDLSKPVPVRLHSACLTGDVFGSRRCDCGEQLKLALARLRDAGGGIILYLPQEGRGLGLANKMRTYQLQDAGLDTVDANTTLGFASDERDYGVAARMLQMLGAPRVILLTNNPAKVDGLAHEGIEVTERMPIETPVTADNRRYLAAKAARAGHQLHHVIDALADDEATDVVTVDEQDEPLAPLARG